MKRILIILLGLFSVAYGQFSPTSAKQAFKWGVSIGTRDSSAYAANDSLVVVINRQGRMMYRSTDGYWKILSNAGASDYVPYTGAVASVNLGDFRLSSRSVATDSILARSSAGGRIVSNSGVTIAEYGAGGGSNMDFHGFAGYDANRSSSYTPRSFTDVNFVDSADGLRLLKSDSAIYYDKVVRTFGNQAVGGNKTFSNDLTVNGLTVGRGGGLVSTNAAFGPSALLSNTTGAGNTAIGAFAGGNLTTGSNNTYIGYFTPSSGVAVSNETVIGASATGNGSNTVTIGNSSVTDNYFTGRTRSANFLATDSVIVGATMADFNYAFKAKSPSAYGVVIENTEATPTGNPILLLRSRSGSTISTAHTFTNNGRLGVGTSTPSATIHVLGASLTSGSSQTIGMFRTGSNTYLDIVQANNATVAGQNITGSTIASTDAIAFATNGIGTLATERLRIAANGNITSISIYNATVGGTNRDVFVDNTGLVGYVSSFRASKKNIKPLYATDWIHKLNPVTFNYRVKDSLGNYTDSAYKELEYGLVAEEVESVNKEMVFYDVDSTGKQKLRGVHYSKLIIPLLAEVQEHKKRIDAQDKIIEALLTRIKALEAKLN